MRKRRDEGGEEVPDAVFAPPFENGDTTDRAVYGLYEASDSWRWSLFCPQRGDVLVIQVPKPIAPEEGVFAAFAVLTKTLMSDGSLIVAAKSLGSSEESTTTSLSRHFNRRPGCIHICHGAEECSVMDEEVVFHCRTVELADGETFSAKYVGTAGKRLLKQVRQGAEREPELAEERPRESGEEKQKAPKRKGPDDETPHRDNGKGVGQSGSPNGERYATLRQRLASAKNKHSQGPGGEGQDVSETLFPWMGPGGGSIPQLSASHKLAYRQQGGPLDPAAARLAVEGGANPDPGRGPTMSGWNKTNSGSVGSQLVMRAAANLQGGGGGGGLPPTANFGAMFGGPQKKKKKKKKKKGKKKKKKRKHGGPPGGGGSSGGGSSGSSTGSSSSDSESSGSGSSGQSAYLPPLRRKAQKHPGSVLKILLAQVESQLSELQGAEGHEAALLGGTKVLTYFHLLVKGSSVQTTSRDGRELYLISVLLDLLRSGQLERLADGLAARFMALQTAAMDGNWVAARHLEIYTPDQATPGGPAITLAARKHAKVLEKVKGHDNRSDYPRGGTWGRQGNAWQWPKAEDSQTAESGKGKNKKGKNGKGKGGAWNGKGYNSWKGAGGGDAKNSEREKTGEKPQNDQK